ncbi:diguanylate cyclase [Duganella radicis]|uniref:diguanylate cyclase n=1 Tax=Duganella radicis TaxID=551988 RepID=A0A6L6PH16_9BURK|nr:diguanylate cyclase [Duganella radicis]
MRDQGRLFPDKILVQLLALQAQVRAEPPRTQAELLAQISAARMLLNQYEAALATADQVVAYGKSLGDDVIVAKGLLAKARVSIAREDSETGYRQALEAEQLALRGDDRSALAQAEIAVGAASTGQGLFTTALERLQRAVDRARQVDDDPMLLFNALRSICRLYVQIKERDKAYATLDELTAIAEKQRLPTQMALQKISEHTVASAFGHPERALRAQLDSLALQRKLGARRMLGSTLNNLADAYLKRRDYPQAAAYAGEALQTTQGLDETDSDATARVNLGHAYLGMGRIAEGRKNFEAGLKWFEDAGNKPGLQEVLLEYGQALEAAGDMAGAVRAYHRERAIYNELFETKRQKALLELQERNETDKKQRQIALLESENHNHLLMQRIWWLLAAVLALVSVVVGLLYRKIRLANARLASKNLELKALSTLDPLTGLYNRRHFQDCMAGLAPGERRGQAGGAPDGDMVGALFLLDVDHFKHVNDTYGHAAGDVVLKMVARQLRAVMRESDLVVRWGGEEFLAYVPALPRQRIDEVARSILLGISSQAVCHQDRQLSVRVSIGYAPFPLAPAGEPLGWERVINLADMALYLAKTQGRNRAYGVRGFAQRQPIPVEEVEQDLERAWRAGQVDLQLVLGDSAYAQECA